jgi:hypothetical protein
VKIKIYVLSIGYVSEIMSKVNSSFRVRIYELPLNRFANVALPQFLGQLQQHESNLNKVGLYD